jgi:hypothetical protein
MDYINSARGIGCEHTEIFFSKIHQHAWKNKRGGVMGYDGGFNLQMQNNASRFYSNGAAGLRYHLMIFISKTSLNFFFIRYFTAV